MIVCIDVGYGEENARAAGVAFNDWSDSRPSWETVIDIGEVQPYVPGQFYRRELPCVMAVLQAFTDANSNIKPSLVIVDGYVWLDGNVDENENNEQNNEQRSENQSHRERGLGAYVYDSLQPSVPVVGVAKNKFQYANCAVEVCRGESRRPLFVTAAGIDSALAGKYISQMHGKHRIPTMLARVDRLSRSAAD